MNKQNFEKWSQSSDILKKEELQKIYGGYCSCIFTVCKNSQGYIYDYAVNLVAETEADCISACNRLCMNNLEYSACEHYYE